MVSASGVEVTACIGNRGLGAVLAGALVRAITAELNGNAVTLVLDQEDF